MVKWWITTGTNKKVAAVAKKQLSSHLSKDSRQNPVHPLNRTLKHFVSCQHWIRSKFRQNSFWWLKTFSIPLFTAILAFAQVQTFAPSNIFNNTILFLSCCIRDNHKHVLEMMRNQKEMLVHKNTKSTGQARHSTIERTEKCRRVAAQHKGFISNWRTNQRGWSGFRTFEKIESVNSITGPMKGYNISRHWLYNKENEWKPLKTLTSDCSALKRWLICDISDDPQLVKWHNFNLWDG